MILLATLKGPHVDFAALSPLIALFGGAIVVLLVGLLGSRWIREQVVPALALVALGASLGLTIWRWNSPESIVSGALRIDRLSLTLNLILAVGGMATVLLAWRSRASREAAHGELHAMLLTTIGGMALLGAAQNTVALFLGLELLSIPLYVLCATEMRNEHSLEAGLKYLIVGSVGSATLLYGIALLYGATGATDFGGIASAISSSGLANNAMLLTGVALCVAGLAFKASVAPFHQWTPDVYEGAPTPITAFMAVATKVAALGVLLRLFDVALIEAHGSWGPALAALATITILVGNVGALGQSSLKRMLAYSSVAQAGYILAGVVVSTQLGAQALVFYLAVYLPMNMAAFAVIVARERETRALAQARNPQEWPNEDEDPDGWVGDGIQTLAGLGRERPLLAWPMTISMLALAGIPATAGFIGKFYLIDAAVAGGYTWLGVVIVIGSMISLGYYLPVIATMWMSPSPAAATTPPPSTIPAIAGGSPELDDEAGGAVPGTGPSSLAGAGGATIPLATGAPRLQPEVAFVAVLAGAATIFFGIVPQPLFNLVHGVGSALGLL
ncbi:MAG TPA: NADH-quinone oxidoreductase subunit N [Solirubrobacteraceae bacterium]|jgi:NADH-quinone oxidoreductase subunit N|nr:NADH-quinone oxidoreductase subunit N [Solirubrobacteraceae bacterium]